MKEISFGTINLEGLLSSKKVELTLIDSATRRPISATYSYSRMDHRLKIMSQENPSIALIIDSEIQLTPSIIAFIGLYLGDGNKTGNIGFSQREINILKFAYDMELRIFGQNFRNRWSILEDTKRFESEAMKRKLKSIEKVIAAKNKSLSGKDLKLAAQREFLIREFLAKASRARLTINRSDINRPVISPLKGAKAPGKSSLEYIHDLYGSKYFLPLWLKIVYDVVNSIINEEKFAWINWVIPPKESPYKLDVSEYILQRVRYGTSPASSRYKVTQKLTNPNFIEISKRGRYKATVKRQLSLSPLLFLVSGFYLAEGDTKKEHVFIFEKKEVPIRVGITSSEERVVRAFIELLENLGENLIGRWKVKVGTKYLIETEEIAQRLGVITVRGGDKGQGYVRTQELHEVAKTWALQEFPFLKKYKDVYTNLEITGVGIPRVHIMAKPTIDAYFVSLVRDAVFHPYELFKYVKDELHE